MKTKTYVITGTTSGIGYATVKELSKNNIVFAGYRNVKKLAETEFHENKNVIPFYIDMEKADSIENAAEFIKTKTEHIDTIINAAGCVIAGAVEELSIDEIRKQFEVNTFSHLSLTQKLLPLLKNGKIINISSMASFGIFPFVSPYCASKRALDILFNSLELENKYNIKYVSIKPGVIATPLWSKSIELNKESLKNENYKKECEYLLKNAYKNESCGLSTDKVVEIILKADRAKNPKSSYTVGIDSKLAQIISLLPQDILNKLIKIGMKLKIKDK